MPSIKKVFEFDQSNEPHEAHEKRTKRPDLQRLASAIAGGKVPFPTDQSTADLAKLAERVAAMRRDQLLEFIAAIAADIRREWQIEGRTP